VPACKLHTVIHFMLHDTYPVKAFKSAVAFEKWLASNHKKANGLWLKIAKAGTGIKTVTHLEALDIALCFGWIDGLRRGLDDEYFVQKFTPRRKKSVWSVINQQKVAQLTRDGRMQQAGLEAIEAAKRNGQWQKAYLSQRNISVPDDFQKALNKNKRAKDFFAKLNSQNRYALLYRLHGVKKEDTKKRKMEEFIKMLENGETIYPN